MTQQARHIDQVGGVDERAARPAPGHSTAPRQRSHRAADMRASILVLALSATAVTGHKFKYEWCKLPAVQGPCKASFKRWYFNEERGECVQFQYGGCKGNKNRFKSASKCRLACGRELCDQEPPSGKCRLFMRPQFCNDPMDEGICLAQIKRYYFDGTCCRKFYFGGVGGNLNNFKSKNACMRVCMPTASTNMWPVLLG
ncbi:Boophilin-H2 [Amphibalanus amphitrite]|uniref:Boophilin-H2 n=1 Tax=Amphibalanus amphitrite TaxID=1232801 RepID=A0A6A4W2Y5_AMPAM|nr:Boophilin-H2 [Amphibalanus amphitrite]